MTRLARLVADLDASAEDRCRERRPVTGAELLALVNKAQTK